MFSMAKIKAVNGAGKAFYANHLAANDYYSEKEKVIGIWSGSFAFDFDLLGKRGDTETFSLFQQNINPLTGTKLTAGMRFAPAAESCPGIPLAGADRRRDLRQHQGAGGGHRHRFRRGGEGDPADAAFAENRPQAHSRRSGPLHADPSAQFPSGLGKAGEQAAEVMEEPTGGRRNPAAFLRFRDLSSEFAAGAGNKGGRRVGARRKGHVGAVPGGLLCNPVRRKEKKLNEKW